MHCYSLCVLFICYCIPGVHLYKKILQIFTRIPDLTQRNMPLLEPQCYWQTDWLFKEEDWVLWTEVSLCLCMFKITNSLWGCQTYSMFNLAILRFCGDSHRSCKYKSMEFLLMLLLLLSIQMDNIIYHIE